METKAIKISAELYEALEFCRDRDSDSGWESKGTIITKLLSRYDDTCQLIHEKEDYWFVINGRRRKFPQLSTATESIKITQDLHDRLNEAKIHPDETINTVLQRLLFSYYGNKLVYHIHIRSANDKDSQDLIFFMRELLQTEPKFNNALFVEVLNVGNYPEIKTKYEKKTLPLSILYDYEELEVWRIEGKHDLDEVRRKLESFIDSSEDFIG
jgi:hypothetical protein